MPRKRKATAKRHPSGQIVRERTTPRQIAERMPHRRGLGAQATDQRAESELGRLALRGAISQNQYLAGHQFARDYGAYLSTIGPPRAINGRGIGFDCGGCLVRPGSEFCLCARRRAIWEASSASLRSAGLMAEKTVEGIALFGFKLSSAFLPFLRLGLEALAAHYGLTKTRKPRYEYAKSPPTAPP